MTGQEFDAKAKERYTKNPVYLCPASMGALVVVLLLEIAALLLETCNTVRQRGDCWVD